MGNFGLTLDMTGPIPNFDGRGIRANITKFGSGRFRVEFDQNLDMDEYIVGATVTGGPLPGSPQDVAICVLKEVNGSQFITIVEDLPTDVQLDIDFAIIAQTTQCCAMVQGSAIPTVQAIRGFNANVARIGPGHVRLTFDVPLAPNEYAVSGVIREKWFPGARYVITVAKGLVGSTAFVDVFTWTNGIPADISFDVFAERYR